LLWRLRRVTAIDTGFIETPSEPDIAPDLVGGAPANERAAAGTASLENHTSLHDFDDKGQNDTLNFEIAQRFLQLDSNGFERLRRYETALWRQVYQAIFVLDVLRRQNLDRSWLSRSSSSMRFRPLRSLLPKA